MNCYENFKAWQNLVSSLQTSKLKPLLESITQLRNEGKTIFPQDCDFFNALKLTCPDNISVIILGQDPYHQQGQAHGLAFSVKDGIKIPPSLRNIFKEISNDVYSGHPYEKSSDLSHWASQGVLLLNTILSVEEGKPLSHAHLGWKSLTLDILKRMAQSPNALSIMLWGKSAHSYENLFHSPKHLILKAPHPSPLSASKGFFGCRHFSATNNWLCQHGRYTIDW